METVSLKITKIVVQRTNSTDQVYLHTELPQSIWPYEGVQIARFEAAAGSGLEYVRQNFGIDPEYLDIRVPLNIVAATPQV